MKPQSDYFRARLGREKLVSFDNLVNDHTVTFF